MNTYNVSQSTSGHFFGITKNVGDYQLIFAPYPPLPFAGDNSTLLNFSILDKENQNVNNIFASLIIKNKVNGSIIQNFPFKFYNLVILLFRILLRYWDYQVSLLVRINGDPTYSQRPISVILIYQLTNPNQVIPTHELITYLVPALAVILLL